MPLFAACHCPCIHAEKFGSDATRLCLADAGDDVTDANFEEESANKILLRLYKEKEWVEETLKTLPTLRTGPMDTVADKMFLAEMSQLINTTEVANARLFSPSLTHTGTPLPIAHGCAIPRMNMPIFVQHLPRSLQLGL